MPGVGYTMGLFAATVLMSIPLGFALTFARISRNRAVKGVTAAYVWIMRGTPLLLQIIVVYYSVPTLRQNAHCPEFLRTLLNQIELKGDAGNVYMFRMILLAFVLNYAAYFAEIFRGGIEAIPKGQYEAAGMLGFSRLQTFFRIILPQVIKRVIPASSNEVITLVKDTSLAYAMGYMEIMYIAKKQMTTFSSLTPLFMAGVFYFAMATLLTIGFGFVEKKLNYYK